ncbi:MAG: hypothetical protein U0996_24380 [Planctomycetaceae bacterium]
MAIDRADWHSGGDFPSELPSENGGTHIGMFLAWIILNGLQGEFHDEESPDELLAVRQRQMTGRDFLFRCCDGKFWDEDLSDEGKRFACAYYSGPSGNGYGQYIDDYEDNLAESAASIYHVADTWENYDVLAPVITRRYESWKGIA